MLSFIGITILLSQEKVALTKNVFVPLLPFPAAQFDATYMYEKLLRYNEAKWTFLWSVMMWLCVYRIAEEIQLLRSDKFDSILLGMGGFYTEKVILVCIDTCLKGGRAREVLVQTGHSGPDTLKTVINGCHYNH